jgi:hypothetical protein
MPCYLNKNMVAISILFFSLVMNLGFAQDIESVQAFGLTDFEIDRAANKIVINTLPIDIRNLEISFNNSFNNTFSITTNQDQWIDGVSFPVEFPNDFLANTSWEVEINVGYGASYVLGQELIILDSGFIDPTNSYTQTQLHFGQPSGKLIEQEGGLISFVYIADSLIDIANMESTNASRIFYLQFLYNPDGNYSFDNQHLVLGLFDQDLPYSFFSSQNRNQINFEILEYSTLFSGNISGAFDGIFFNQANSNGEQKPIKGFFKVHSRISDEIE